MTSRFGLPCIATVALLVATTSARAAEFYVAPDGDDTAAGTLDKPFASLPRAQRAASPGDTVWIRGGTYVFGGTYAFGGTDIAVGVLFDKSGAEGKRINYFAYKDEKP